MNALTKEHVIERLTDKLFSCAIWNKIISISKRCIDCSPVVNRTEFEEFLRLQTRLTVRIDSLLVATTLCLSKAIDSPKTPNSQPTTRPVSPTISPVASPAHHAKRSDKRSSVIFNNILDQLPTESYYRNIRLPTTVDYVLNEVKKYIYDKLPESGSVATVARAIRPQCGVLVEVSISEMIEELRRRTLLEEIGDSEYRLRRVEQTTFNSDACYYISRLGDFCWLASGCTQYHVACDSISEENTHGNYSQMADFKFPPHYGLKICTGKYTFNKDGLRVQVRKSKSDYVIPCGVIFGIAKRDTTTLAVHFIHGERLEVLELIFDDPSLTDYEVLILQALLYPFQTPPNVLIVHNANVTESSSFRIIQELVHVIFTTSRSKYYFVETEDIEYYVRTMCPLKLKEYNIICPVGNDTNINQIVNGLLYRPDADHVIPNLTVAQIPYGNKIGFCTSFGINSILDSIISLTHCNKCAVDVGVIFNRESEKMRYFIVNLVIMRNERISKLIHSTLLKNFVELTTYPFARFRSKPKPANVMSSGIPIPHSPVERHNGFSFTREISNSLSVTSSRELSNDLRRELTNSSREKSRVKISIISADKQPTREAREVISKRSKRIYSREGLAPYPSLPRTERAISYGELTRLLVPDQPVYLDADNMWEVMEREKLFIHAALCNLPKLSLGCHYSPFSHPCDGTMDFVYIDGDKKLLLQYLRTKLLCHSGEHVHLDSIGYYKINAFHLELDEEQECNMKLYVDGEEFPPTDYIYVEILKSLLKAVQISTVSPVKGFVTKRPFHRRAVLFVFQLVYYVYHLAFPLLWRLIFREKEKEL